MKTLMTQLALNAFANPGHVRQWRIAPSGDSCLVIEVADRFSFEANRAAAVIARQIKRLCADGSLHGVLDVVPAMVSVGIYYHPDAVCCENGEMPYRCLTRQLNEALQTFDIATGLDDTREITLPVCYGGAYGPDLEEVAKACGMTPQEVIRCHTEKSVDVLMLGFAPGHAYIGDFDKRLNIPRRSVPRTLVQRGSIGLANSQSVIYPADLPGGWNLIGRTPRQVFDIAQDNPCLLHAGDRVRFVSIDADEFQALMGAHT